MSKELKVCPCCGGEVAISDMGYYLMITRVSGMKASSMCKCRIFMESDTFAKNDLEAKNEARKNLIEKWNRRPSPWHTGTPTEEGWYLIAFHPWGRKENGICYMGLEWKDGHWFDHVNDYETEPYLVA